jgi:O-antigen/teichoic acid export membrane protein
MLKTADSVKYKLSSETIALPPASPGDLTSAPKPFSLAALTAIFAGGNIISMLLRMAGGVLTTRVVEPAMLGLFTGMGLVLGYAPFLELGVVHGLSRELPYYVGQGEHSMVRTLAAAAQAWALLVGGLVTLVLLGVSGWQLWAGKYSLAAGWATYAFSALVFFYGHYYLQTTYLSRHDFARLAAINMAQNGTGLVLVVLVWWLSFYGLCLRLLAVKGVFIALLWKWRPLKIAPRWNRAYLWHLLKVGAPIFGAGQLYAGWVVLDSTLVLHYLGMEGLGLYALALMVAPALQLLPDALAQISYPRMAEEYGRTGRLVDLCRIVQRPIFWLTLGMAPIVLLAWFILPPLANFLLPKYVDGLAAAQWALISSGLMSLAPICNAFNVIKRQDLYVVAIVLGLAAYFVSLMWLIRHQVALVAFAQAMVLGKVVFLGMCYFTLNYLKRREALR